MRRLLIIVITISCSCSALFAEATNISPGGLGNDAHWPSAAKNGFGTSNSLSSKVWFTLQGGVMTEVFYPRLDVPNTQTLQFVVVSEGGVETESDDMTHRIEIPDPRSLTFRQVNTAKNGVYAIAKTYTTDPQKPTVLIDVKFTGANDTPYSLYVYYDPSLNNSGRHDTAWTEGQALVAVDGDVASAMISSVGFAEKTNGHLGTTDGLLQLRKKGRITESYERAEDGNVVQVARIPNRRAFTLALGFGKNSGEALRNAETSLAKGFARTRRDYEAGWHGFHQSIANLAPVDAKYDRQLRMSAMVLKGLEDKTFRGAMIASPSVPWGGGPNANEPTISGYHAVWSRDLYQVATAFEAVGDKATARRALDYLFRVQQKSDGSFPQNSWVDGRPIGDGLQMDQVAFPLLLAYQLRRTDRKTWLKHIKPAADFIVRKGPYTEQDRWEEKPGLSPATLAAQIAGLVCASRIAILNRDKAAADTYLNRADDWVRDVERWTATSTGPQGKGSYYLRITENTDPNDGATIEINSGGGTFDEREIVDAGFLELVRLGIKDANDPLIVKSLAIVDKLIKVNTPNGSAWYRYNHDAYGELPDGSAYDGRTGVGRLWVLLTGERGEYDLARGDTVEALKRLDAMMAFANDGLMLPEQVWDQEKRPSPELVFGEGTGSATPLAWSMAQFVRLAINIQSRHNTETPKIVAARYRKRPGKR
ncbi:MAG: glucan 1,4-alpha-glucosidase [Pyrinomonadaceae bacterium]